MKKRKTTKPGLFREIEQLKSPLPQICLSGNGEALVEGVLGILEYDSHKIRLRTGKLSVAFLGTGLFLRCLNPHTAVVSGKIETVDLCSGTAASAAGGKEKKG